MMFTPAAPKAGPIGGAGFAFQVGICNLIILETFLAMTAPYGLVIIAYLHCLVLDEPV